MLKITDNRRTEIHTFESLQVGDIFEVNDQFWIKTQKLVQDAMPVNCVNLGTGRGGHCPPYMAIIPREAELTLK